MLEDRERIYYDPEITDKLLSCMEGFFKYYGFMVDYKNKSVGTMITAAI